MWLRKPGSALFFVAVLAIISTLVPSASAQAYEDEVRGLETSLDELVESYRSGQDVQKEVDNFTYVEWEEVEVHEEIEGSAPQRYLDIWTAINGLRAAVEAGAPPEEVEARADDVKEALWAGLEALEEDAAETYAGGAPLSGGAREQVASLESRLSDAVEAYSEGNRDEAASDVRDTFFAFEDSSFRDSLASRDNALYAELEAEMLELKSLMDRGASVESVEGQLALVNGLLDEGLSAVSAEASPAALFTNSLVIILREGFEAILVISAILAYLSKVGKEGMRRSVYAGVLAAIGLTVATYVAARNFVEISGAQREVLEGVTMLIAVVVLFYVSYWLISKTESRRWQSFIQGKVDSALSRGSGLTLGSLSFVVVYREGFETVLFYQALYFSGGGGPRSNAAILAGFLVGLALLAAIYVAFSRYGVRIPTRQFFAATSAMLYYLAFKFAGDGVRELQEGGVVGETSAGIAVPSALTGWLGVHPYLETLALQGVLLVALVTGIVYVFWIRPTMETEEEGG